MNRKLNCPTCGQELDLKEQIDDLEQELEVAYEKIRDLEEQIAEQQETGHDNNG